MSTSNFDIEKTLPNNALLVSGIHISSGAPSDGQILVYNSSNNQFEYQDQEAQGISGIPIAPGSPSDGQVLVYNSTTNQWEYQDQSGGATGPTGPTGPKMILLVLLVQ